MKRLLAAAAVLLLLWLGGDAQTQRDAAPKNKNIGAPSSGFPKTVRVRLWYLHPPASLKLQADAGQARLRKCATCNETPVTALGLRAVKSRIAIDGDKATATELYIAGMYSMSSGSEPPVKADFPVEVRGGGGTPAGHGDHADGRVHCGRAGGRGGQLQVGRGAEGDGGGGADLCHALRQPARAGRLRPVRHHALPGPAHRRNRCEVAQDRKRHLGRSAVVRRRAGGDLLPRQLRRHHRRRALHAGQRRGARAVSDAALRHLLRAQRRPAMAQRGHANANCRARSRPMASTFRGGCARLPLRSARPAGGWSWCGSPGREASRFRRWPSALPWDGTLAGSG